MKLTRFLLLAGAAFLTTTAPPMSHAQASPSGIYIIFDGSGSMWGQLEDESYKIHVAKSVLQEFVSRDFPGRELALRAYGHRRERDCDDTELVVPFSPPATAADRFRAFLQRINPLGRTPITKSLRAALQDFGEREGEIILISDGIETCNDDPCALMNEWRSKNVAVRVHVVGFGVEEKEKAALQCIADAAGTEYHDAQTAESLAGGLSSIYAQSITSGFRLIGRDPAGNTVRVEGRLAANSKAFDVRSHARNQVDAGEYELVAGIRTANGSLYQPITTRASVSEEGETVLEVEVPRPPTVHARFMDTAGDQRGSLVYAFQDGAEVFRFRWIDTVFADPGDYEFRTAPNADNRLSVTATIAAGEQKEIVFRLARTVQATFRMEASESGIWFRENYELWQNGELAYKVHVSNGARVLPGTYDLRLPNRLGTYVKEGLVITDDDAQRFTVTVPVGHVTFVYLKPDGSRDSEDRVFVSTATGAERVFKRSGERHPLIPGTYTVMGWSRKGEYDVVTFDVALGKDKEIVLQAK
jgi:hypothetical protein